MKKLIIITSITFVFLLLGFWQSCRAVDLLSDYPSIPGAETPGPGTTFPGLISYIYMFALATAGFVALVAILIGAIMYIFSAGNPSKAKDAKDRIFSALLGILILLASVLILRTINPDLVTIGFALPGGEEPEYPPDPDYIYKCIIENMPGCDKYWAPFCKDNKDENIVSCKNYAEQYNATYWGYVKVERDIGCGDLGCISK